MKLKPGCLCRSLAGNDQGDYAAVADGEKMTAASPGRKNKKHIQAEKTPVLSGSSLTDEAIKAITAIRR